MLEVGDRVEVRFYIVPWKLYTAFGDGALAVKPGERSGGEPEDHWAVVRYVEPESTVIDTQVGRVDVSRPFDEQVVNPACPLCPISGEVGDPLLRGGFPQAK